MPPGFLTGAKSGEIITLEATVIRADGTREELGVIASSDPDRIPLTPRKEASDGSKPL